MACPPLSVTSIDAPRSANHAIHVLALAMISAMFDGFYGQAIAFVSPAIAKDWSLPTSAFGPIFSIGLVGLIVGAVTIWVYLSIGKLPVWLSLLLLLALVF